VKPPSYSVVPFESLEVETLQHRQQAHSTLSSHSTTTQVITVSNDCKLLSSASHTKSSAWQFLINGSGSAAYKPVCGGTRDNKPNSA